MSIKCSACCSDVLFAGLPHLGAADQAIQDSGSSNTAVSNTRGNFLLDTEGCSSNTVMTWRGGQFAVAKVLQPLLPA